jgi:Ca-activated chloride channel family protein
MRVLPESTQHLRNLSFIKPGRQTALLLALCLLAATPARSDTGTLIPRDKQAPDPSILSLDEMRVDVVIDSGDAHVSIVQIFSNHTAKIEEGTYRFALPSGSTVSDFAVWDGPVRIPAIILERKRAEQVYDEARMQAIDPGLLEAGERDNSDPRNPSLFTATILPIAPYATKRLELEYHQRLTATDFKQLFALSLKPDAGEQQSVRSFHLHFVVHSAIPLQSFATPSTLFALNLTTHDDHTVEGSFQAFNLALSEDFSATWQLSQQAADQVEILTHRDPHTPLPAPGDAAAAARSNAPEPGFFQAQFLVGDPKSAAAVQQPPRTLILLFDNSLSMQWDKLERSYAALEATLRSLKPADRFNLILFNQTIAPFQPQPVPASPQSVQQGLEFVRASKLRGGTDLLKALTAALAQSTAADTSIAIFTDGGSNRGETVLGGKIAARPTPTSSPSATLPTSPCSEPSPATTASSNPSSPPSPSIFISNPGSRS